MSKGTFQERLNDAIEEAVDVVTITRNDGLYRVAIERQTEKFGTLRQQKTFGVEHATPGMLVSIIELVSHGLTSAVETIESAQK